MKKKKTLLVVIIVAIFLLVAGLLVWFLWPKKSNKEIFTDAIKNSFGLNTTIDEDAIGEYEDYFKDKILKLNINGYAAMAGERSANNIDLYYGKQQMYLSLDESVDGEKVGVEAVLKENKLYFTLTNILSKYYYVDIESGNIEVKDDKTMDKLADLLDESLFGMLDDKNVVTESAEITINKVEYKVKKYSYDYTGTDLYNAINNLVKGIKNDKELYDALDKAFSSIEEATVTLDDVLDLVLSESEELKSYTKKLFTYTVYLDGSDVISTVISVVIPQESMNIPISLTMNNVENKGLVYKEMSVSTMGQKIFNAKYEETSEENANISVGVMNEEVLTGYVKNTDKNFKFRLEGTDVLGSMLSGSYFFSFEDEDEDKVDTKFYIDLDLDKSDAGVKGKFKAELSMEDEGVVLDYDIKTEEVKEIPNVDLSGALPYEEMTEKDKEALQSFGSMYQSVDLEDYYDYY